MAQKPDVIGGEILPIPDIPSKGKMALDARKAEFPAIEPLRPPKGAPNVVIVLIDDMGFGAPSANGGPCVQPWDFYTDPKAKALFKRRLRYIVARWGAATSLLAWEFCNETQGWFETNEAAVEAEETVVGWYADVTAHLASLDANRRPITTSWWNGTGPVSSWALIR